MSRHIGFRFQDLQSTESLLIWIVVSHRGIESNAANVEHLDVDPEKAASVAQLIEP